MKRVKFGNWILFFLALGFSVLITSESLSKIDYELKAEGPDSRYERSEPFWTEGLRLSLGEKISTHPAIYALENEIYVVWSDNRIGQRELFMRKCKNGGLTWSEEERLTESQADSIRPAVASDKEQVHLVWEEKSETDSAIYYKRWDGKSWSREQVLSSGLSNSRHPDVAVTKSFHSSIVYVVWESNVQNRIVAYLSQSKDSGDTWLKPRPIASPIADAYVIPAWNTSEPKVADGMESAYVVWRDERELTGQIFIKRWDEVSAGSDIRLSDEGNYRRPDVSVSAQAVYVAWEGSSEFGIRNSEFGIREQFPPVSDIFLTQSFDGGQTFNHASQVTQSAAESTMSEIIAFADDAWLFWQDGRMGNWEIYLARKSSLSENWGQPEQFTKTEMNIDSIMPAVASSLETRPENRDGFLTQIHLLWVERENETTSYLMYSRRDTIPPPPPDKPIHLDVNSQKGYDNDDTLTFYWPHPSGIRNEKHEERNFIERPTKYNIYFTTASVLEPYFSRVQLEFAGTTDKSSYSFKAESGKTYRIAVEAFDEVGNASELSEFSEPIFVDSHAPKVLIHFPKPSTSIFGSTPVIVTCFDDNLVEWRLQYKFTTKAAISWGEKEGSEWKPLAYSNESIEHQRVAFWDVSKLQGVYTLELIAIDEAGNQSKVDIPVVVDNTPPIPITSGDIGAELVSSDLDSDYQSPAWSPDGSMIAYASNEGGAYDIWIFDLKTRTKNRLTRDTAFDVNPVWSPDSRWLAFQSFDNGNWDVWVISIDGSQRLPVVGGEDGFTGVNHVDSDLTDIVMDTTPAWSSDGDQLAFSSNVDDDGEIWLITNINEVLQGSKPNLTQLTQNGWEDSHPTWSPDGTKIAFQSNRHNNWDIFVINIDGSAVHEVTTERSEQEEQLTSSVANEIKPKWSPDGKRIMFISDRATESQGEILAIEIRREGEAPVEPEIISLSPWSAEVSASVSHADWSPDLKSMVYQAGNNIYLTDFNFPPPQIEAIITRPYQGEYIGAEKSQNTSEFWVDIIGLARGMNFQEYRLEYVLSDDSPAKLNWIPIGGVSTSQVTQIGFLGRLDTRKLQGKYILRLSVLGKNGDRAVDSVSIFVEHERPRLVVAEPPDGLITDKPLIVVSGETEANVKITINDEWVKLEPTSKTARFDTNLLLQEGDNIITIVARHTEFGIRNSEFGLETMVQRRVFLAREKMTINVDSPKDFKVVNVPYVTVEGSVGQTAKVVKIQKTIVIGPEVQLQPLMSLAQNEPKADLSRERSEREGVDEQSEKLKTFQRIILLDEGVNLISIEVTDQLNRLTRIQRHVIYEKLTVIGRDINPPAITNIMPPDGTAVADARPEISAILVDDVKIAPETIALIFDGKEIDRKKLGFNEEDGSFSYTIEESFLGDGEHNFTMSVQDTSGNSEPKSIKFFIDTEPLEIAISAKSNGRLRLTDQADAENSSRLKVILTSNKPLQSIPMATLIPIDFRLPRLGYSINLNRVVADLVDGKAKPFRFEGFFDATPLQNSFTLNALVTDNFGRTHTVYGYYSRGSLSESIAPLLWGQMKLGIEPIPSESTRLKSEMSVTEANRLGISGIIEAIFPTTILEPVHSIVLRSQDGLDLDRLTAQRQNAEDRGLELIDIVHVVETDQKREEIAFILRLPIPIHPVPPLSKGREGGLAFFHWDARLQRWEAMDAIRNFSEESALNNPLTPFDKGDEVKGWIQATVNEFGAYALLSDETPPTIANLRPRDHQEVPLDRFLVEAEIHDNGSGIDKDRIELLIDDKPAEFTYEPAHNRITYLPSNLKTGLHTLKLSVQDRASNIQTIYSTFFTRDIFDFAEEVIAYPNPAKDQDIVTIRFKLTKTADVTLKIYSVAGEIIYVEQKVNAIGRINEWFVWDCKNQAKLPIASGVYVYIIEAENSDGQRVRRSGKIAVVR